MCSSRLWIVTSECVCDMVTYEQIAEHLGHDIVVAQYGDGVNVAVECETCWCVIVDCDRP